MKLADTNLTHKDIMEFDRLQENVGVIASWTYIEEVTGQEFYDEDARSLEDEMFDVIDETRNI